MRNSILGNLGSTGDQSRSKNPRSLKRTTKWGAKYFTHEKSYYPVPKSSMELGDVNVMKTPPVVSMDSETAKDKAGALPPAVYSSQPREGIEQNTCMPPSADHDDGVTGITFVDDSVFAVVAVAD